MTKKLLYSMFLMALSFVSSAQKEAANWYFGFNAGVGFLPSPVARTDGKLQSEEGCATISDNSGNLLFYTNGRIINNRAHQVLKNSSDLLGDRSSTQNVVIVPQPGNDSIYFVFTISSIQQQEGGLYYSVVNMRGDNGFGEVIQKNVLLLQYTYEKITAVRHCNNRDVWVAVHKWDSDAYYTYLVSPSGVSMIPVISHTGFHVGGASQNAVGACKFSAKGNKLASAFGYGIDKVQLLDFNNFTGRLANSIVFSGNTYVGNLDYSGSYGIEFSPDARLLYMSAYNNVDDPAKFYQFDISSSNIAAIQASRFILSQNNFGGTGNIQAAIDGKLYITWPGKRFLGVINQPNNIGAACNYVEEGLQVVQPSASQSIKLGLPTFIQSYFDVAYVPYDFARNPGSCLDKNITFTINHISGIDSLHWYFGDGGQSTQFSATQNHLYTSPGFYDVVLKIFRSACSGVVEEAIVKQIWIAPTATLLGSDRSACDFGETFLHAGVTGVNYAWSNGSTSDSININGPGIFWLEVEKNGCTLRDSISFIKILPPPVTIFGDTLVCSNKPVQLQVQSLAAAVEWNTGAQTASITVDRPGRYKVTVTPGSGCVASDSLDVSWGNCDLLIPAAFSPNGDGVNDRYGLVSPINATSFAFKIYNRSGQVIFQTKDQLDKWDGTIKNKPAAIGLYPWIITYTPGNGFTQTEKGTVMLIR